jgi:hypothetical protein
MSKIKDALTASAANKLVLQNIYQWIQVGDVKTDLPISAFSVVLDGETPINIDGQNFVRAYAKLASAGLLGVDVKLGNVLPVASGGFGNKQVTYNLTNSGVTTPAVYGHDFNRGNGGTFGAQMDVVVAGSNQVYSGYDFLLIDGSNFSKATIEGADGWTSDIDDITELASLAVSTMDLLEADGLLSGLYLIDGADIPAIRIFATGGNLDVLIVNF